MFLVLILYALFASVFTVSKEALFYSKPFFLVGGTKLLAGIGMVLYLYLRDRSALCYKKGTLGRILKLGFINIYLTNVFEFWGLQYLTSFKTCFIYSLSPFVAALFSYLLFNETLTKRKWWGLAIGFLGFIPVLMSQSTQEDAAGTLWVFSWAELAVICAAVSSVYGWIVLKQLSHHDGYSPLAANGYSMLLGGTLALVHSFFAESWDPIPVTNMAVVLQCSLFLVIVSNCICYNLYGYLLRRFSATFMSFAGLTTPLFTVLFGWLVFNEIANVSFYASYVIVFLGLVVFYQEELRMTAKAAFSRGKRDEGSGAQVVVRAG